MLPAGDTAGLSVLDTPYNSGREHSALSCSRMMAQWSETEWFDQAMQLVEGGGGSAIIKAGNVASQTVSAHPSQHNLPF